LRPGRKSQELKSARIARARGGRSLFKDCVSVGTADPQRSHAGAPRSAIGLPVAQFGVDGKRAVLEIDQRIGLREIEAWRNLPMLEGEHRLDETGHARGGIEMPDIGLERTDCAETFPVGGPAES